MNAARAAVAAVLFAFVAPAFAKDTVSVTEGEAGKFVATLESDRELPIAEAQSLLMPAAKAACGSVPPAFGRYRFESTQPLTPDATEGARFRFTQEFGCAASHRPPPGLARRTVISDADRERLVAQVIAETRAVLGPGNEGVLTDFHGKFSGPFAAMLPLPRWKAEQLAFHERAGGIERVPLTKATVYIDPPDSPMPGVYVAVDFQARYARVPFRCGFVLWVYDREARLSVMRIEDGSLTSEEAARLTPAQLASTKAALRCFAP